jgi:hypothetical protein
MAKSVHTNDKMVWGIILISLGVIFLLQKFFHVEILSQLWQFWPLALIVWGIILVVNKK